MTKGEEIKAQILELTREYYKEVHAREKPFEAGKSFVNYERRYFNDEEMVNLVGSSLDFWLTADPWVHEFETHLTKWLDVKYCALTNSSSSANLLAFFTLTSPQLGEKRIKRGDEVITVTAGFSIAVSPIIQYGTIPVFVDVCLPSFDINVTELEEACVEGETKAIMIAHSLGNPFNVEAIKELYGKHNIWLVESNCDALGSEYAIDGTTKKTGTQSRIGVNSLYPPHHMTMGEGGAVYTNDSLLSKITRSFRDWGRDCWCVGGIDDACGCRFTGQFGQLPNGYDHKYIYSHFGFNLKVADMQAAIGCAQLGRLDGIIAKRRSNYKTLCERLKNVPGIIPPIAEKNSNPSWFGFLIAVKEGAGFTRNGLTRYVENNKVQTRNLFAGNLVKHLASDEIRGDKSAYCIAGDLKITDFIMNSGFWMGVHPGMAQDMLQRMINTIKEFCIKHAR